MPLTRKGGLAVGRDPDLQAQIDRGATNRSALTSKQLYDGKRIDIKLDVRHAPAIKQRLTKEAAAYQTSASQLGSFLLAWALRELRTNRDLIEAVEGGLEVSHGIKNAFDLPVSDDLIAQLVE